MEIFVYRCDIPDDSTISATSSLEFVVTGDVAGDGLSVLLILLVLLLVFLPVFVGVSLGCDSLRLLSTLIIGVSWASRVLSSASGTAEVAILFDGTEHCEICLLFLDLDSR